MPGVGEQILLVSRFSSLCSRGGNVLTQLVWGRLASVTCGRQALNGDVLFRPLGGTREREILLCRGFAPPRNFAFVVFAGSG